MTTTPTDSDRQAAEKIVSEYELPAVRSRCVKPGILTHPPES